MPQRASYGFTGYAQCGIHEISRQKPVSCVLLSSCVKSEKKIQRYAAVKVLYLCIFGVFIHYSLHASRPIHRSRFLHCTAHPVVVRYGVAGSRAQAAAHGRVTRVPGPTPPHAGHRARVGRTRDCGLRAISPSAMCVRRSMCTALLKIARGTV